MKYKTIKEQLEQISHDLHNQFGEESSQIRYELYKIMNRIDEKIFRKKLNKE